MILAIWDWLGRYAVRWADRPGRTDAYVGGRGEFWNVASVHVRTPNGQRLTFRMPEGSWVADFVAAALARHYDRKAQKGGPRS